MSEEPKITIVQDGKSYEDQAIQAYIAKEISFKSLMISVGCGRSQMRKLIADYRKYGSVVNRPTKKKTGNRAFSKNKREKIIGLVKENYPDFGPKFAAEKLLQRHGIKIAGETLRGWMIEAGIWQEKEKRQPRIFQPRKPRGHVGELVQVDGSYHRWFEKRGPETCLLVFIDDATSRLMHMMFVDNESSFNYMRTLKDYIHKFGRPVTLYADKYGVFRSANPTKFGEYRPTQFSRACTKLDIKIICAATPQAKGRVERANRTLQDRLIKEMRLRNISTMDEANGYLPIYIAEHNAKFAKEPADSEDFHRSTAGYDLDALFVFTRPRKVFQDLTVSFNKIRFIIEPNKFTRKLIGKMVTVAVYLDGSVEILYEEAALPYKVFDKVRRVEDVEIADSKQLGTALALAKCISEIEPHHYRRNNNIPAGFREFFAEPTDRKSVELQNAGPEVRAQNNGRNRSPMARHPIVVVEKRLNQVAAIAKKLH